MGEKEIGHTHHAAMTSPSYPYQYQPQPPSIPRITGGKRGPSGPLVVSSSSEDEDSDHSECLPPPAAQHLTVRTTELPAPRSPRNVPAQVFPSPAALRAKTGGGGGGVAGAGGKLFPPPVPVTSSKDPVPTLILMSTADDPNDDAADEALPPAAAAPPATSGAAVVGCKTTTNFAHELDHDYDNVASPCSSTSSGPIYVRPPGFTHHAQEVVVSVKAKIVQKKSRPAAVIHFRDGFKKREQTPPKSKPRREPLPMRLRALPQSFWQQPNATQQVSPATMFPILPPLCNKDTEEDITDVRPVTPPHVEGPPDNEKGKQPAHHGVSERKITVANTDLLFKLFENIAHEEKKAIALQAKRGLRPKRTLTKSAMKGLLSGNDPYLVDAISEKLFPQLSIETSRHGGNTTLQLVTLGSGDKTVTLPSLSVEQNYTQMLSELVMHI